jgi:phosphoribosylamine--glycine ligase
VVDAVAVGDTLAAAQDAAYTLLGKIHLDGGHFRTDIAGTSQPGRSG